MLHEEDKAWAWRSELESNSIGELFIVEYSTHADAGDGEHKDGLQGTHVAGDHDMLDASHDGGKIDDDVSDVDHDPELQEEGVSVASPKSARSSATPTPATPGSPRMPVASATTDASS